MAASRLGSRRTPLAELSTADRLEIEQLYAKYNHAIDFGDGDAWAATFTADGSFDRGRGAPPFVGTEALANLAIEFASSKVVGDG